MIDRQEEVERLAREMQDEDWEKKQAAKRLRQANGPEAQQETRQQQAKPKVEWPTLDDVALYGLAGDLVSTIRPHSEADPVAILIQTLVAAGNIIARRCYYQVESDRHHANLFVALVGQSSKSRKGTSWGRVRAVAKIADPAWADSRCRGGLSSGEGLINEVRDSVTKWNTKEKAWEEVDPGVSDKRLMVVEPEFAAALSVMERHGNTLSPLLRKGWDGDTLETMTRSSSLKSTGSHISIIAHITEDELRARLTRTDAANGFANRFLFPLVRRSKELPFGGDLTDFEVLSLGSRLQSTVKDLPVEHRMTMTDEARSQWAKIYGVLSEERPGLLGAITARAEAQCIRLALIYALLDGAQQIDAPHLTAALAIWEYCETSAAHIFGSSLGDSVADEILRALQTASNGMSRTAIRDLLGRHQSADRIGAALALLLKRGSARMEGRESGGRPVEVWFATEE